MTVTMVRDLPDAQRLVREILETSGALVGEDPPAALATKVPCFTAYRSGGNAIRARLADQPLIHVIAWGGTLEEARDLAETGRTLIFRAWQSGYTSSLGRIGRVQERLAPVRVTTGQEPYGVWRFDADYSIVTRPAP